MEGLLCVVVAVASWMICRLKGCEFILMISVSSVIGSSCCLIRGSNDQIRVVTHVIDLDMNCAASTEAEPIVRRCESRTSRFPPSKCLRDPSPIACQWPVAPAALVHSSRLPSTTRRMCTDSTSPKCPKCRSFDAETVAVSSTTVPIGLGPKVPKATRRTL